MIRRTESLPAARQRLQRAVGVAGTVRAAAVAGTFQMMNRVVDATGVPIGPSKRAIAPELALSP